MKHRALASAFLLCLGLSCFAIGGEVSGVTLPDTVAFEGKTLKLNGMGLRKKVVFKVYVAGLYLETPTKDAAAGCRRPDSAQRQTHSELAGR